MHACIGLLLRHPLPILGRLTDEEDPEFVPAEADSGWRASSWMRKSRRGCATYSGRLATR